MAGDVAVGPVHRAAAAPPGLLPVSSARLPPAGADVLTGCVLRRVGDFPSRTRTFETKADGAASRAQVNLLRPTTWWPGPCSDPRTWTATTRTGTAGVTRTAATPPKIGEVVSLLLYQAGDLDHVRAPSKPRRVMVGRCCAPRSRRPHRGC